MSDLRNKTDAELASDARMVVQELSAFLAEFKRRRIETDIRTYERGHMEIDIYRDKRETL